MCFLLNMFAANISQPLSEPNVLYIDNKPPKIVKMKHSAKRKDKKIETKTKKKKKISSQTASELKSNIKREKVLSTVKHDDEQMGNTESNDPLSTPPQIEVKVELHEGKFKLQTDSDGTEEEKYFSWEEKDDDEREEENENDGKQKSKRRKRKLRSTRDSEYEEEDFEIDEELSNGDVDDEDEPLIFLKETEAEGKRKRKKETPHLRNCLVTCKYKCTTNFSKRQRIDIYDYYWQLDKEKRVNFIRQHIRKRVLTRIRNKKRGNNCCYFMKIYKIGATPSNISIESGTDENTINKGLGDSEDLTKVCRKFFEGTLGIANREIKEALEGYELQQEKIMRPIRDILEEEQSKLPEKLPEKTARPQQFLDPETGNLTDTKPKKKHKRRKPGEPEPERFPRPINCAIRCIFKCHKNFSEEERKQICDIFWSLDFKRRKDFILARIETKDVETPTTPEFRKTNRPTRAYQTRFFLRSGISSENKRVCKHFMMSTLCINRKFIENAIKYADKATGNYTGVDGRGKHLVHKITPERKQAILDHINSYPVWLPSKKSKIRCLHHTLSIKRMYKEYKDKCVASQTKPVSAFYYYKVFHDDFRLMFLSNKDSKKGRGFLNINPNISHYTGDEPGGCWLDSQGNQLDLAPFRSNDNSKLLEVQPPPVAAVVSCSSKESTLHDFHQTQQSSSTDISASLHLNQPLNFATAGAAQHLAAANFVDPSTSAVASMFNPRTIFQTTVQNLYDGTNLPQSANASSIFRMI